MQATVAELKKEGYQVVAISPDNLDSVAKAALEKGVDYTLLSDLKMEAIRKFGLAFSLDAETVVKYKGYGIKLLPTPDIDDKILPVPAVFLVDAAGQITYAYTNPDYKQRLDPQELLQVARLHTEVVDYQQGETTLQGYLARPKHLTGPVPGVLVIHEWWGLNDYARQRARQLAELGYVAFAADIYGKGRRAATGAEAGALAGEFKNDRQLLRDRCEAGLAQLRDNPHTDPAKLAAIGYCFGGTAVLELARGGGDLAAVVSFHGGLDTPMPAQAGDIQASVLVCHGADDPHVPAADIAALEKELTAAGADWQLVKYSGAVHSFTNPMHGSDNSQGVAYNPNADTRSWALMQSFFNERFEE
ncbi:MAG: dienelactone hydrolase family protein [Verrucomicrobia bacterium]|nr:dienelactone hydrolase family protein [Verrucomicrobiota bacterium]